MEPRRDVVAIVADAVELCGACHEPLDERPSGFCWQHGEDVHLDCLIECGRCEDVECIACRADAGGCRVCEAASAKRMSTARTAAGVARSWG